MKTTPIGSSNGDEQGSNLETVKMSIDASAVDVLMNNLTNLYSDPVIAVLREYTSNAFDSHVRAGVTAPIEVKTPSHNGGSMLIVQDFGVGMSKDEIANVYSRYGLSTKTDSNDEIGGFGLGCKSALAISPRFDIVSVKDGIKTTAYVQKNIKGVGVVHFVSEEPTTDANGVTVSIPVEYNNFNRFDKREMVRFFVGMPSGSVKLNGEIVSTSFDKDWTQLYLAGERVGAYFIGDTSYGTDGAMFNSIAMTIGGVSYTSDIFQNLPEVRNFRSHVGNFKIVIDLPIGSVDLTPSRESIMLTDRSNKTVAGAVSNIENAIEAIVQDKVNAAPDMKQAVKAYYDEVARGFWKNSINYRGTLLENYVALPNLTKFYRTNSDKLKTVTGHTVNSIQLYEGFGFHRKSEDNRFNLIFIKGAEADHDALSKSVYYYMMSKHATGKVSAIVYSDAILTDNPVLAEMVKHSNITAAEVIEVATKYRSDSRKASMAAAKAAKAEGRTLSKVASLPVWTVEKDSNHIVVPMDVTLIEQKPVAYVHANDSMIQLRRVFPTLGYHYENGGAKIYENNVGTVSIMANALEGRNVVFLSSNRNVGKFLASFPTAIEASILVKAYVEKLAIEQKKSMMAHMLMEVNNYGRYSANSTYSLVSLAEGLKEHGLIQDIKDDFVRNILVDSLQLKAEAATLNSRIANNWVQATDDMKNEVEVIRGKHEAVVSALVLLNSFRIDNRVYGEHAVRYINMIFAEAI
jgi:hypothetical protein